MIEERGKRKKRANRTRAEWIDEVAQWRGSGQSIRHYAGENDLHPATLAWWKKRLSEPEKGKSKRGTATKSFVPLVVRDPVRSALEHADEVVEVVLSNGRRFRVPSSFDIVKVALLADALEGTNQC